MGPSFQLSNAPAPGRTPARGGQRLSQDSVGIGGTRVKAAEGQSLTGSIDTTAKKPRPRISGVSVSEPTTAS